VGIEAVGLLRPLGVVEEVVQGVKRVWGGFDVRHRRPAEAGDLLKCW